MAEPVEMPFGGLTHVGPKNHVLDGVKVGRMHSPPRGVTRWRCGLSQKLFGHLYYNAAIWWIKIGNRNSCHS